MKSSGCCSVFFIDREPGCADLLCEELGCEQAQVYRVRERALQKITTAMYGAWDDPQPL